MNVTLQILLCIAVLILASKACGALAGRVGMPVVLGELLAGVVLGPTFLHFWDLPWFRAASPDAISAHSVFMILAQIGVILLMFAAGLETDVKMMRQALTPAFLAASGGVLLPIIGGVTLGRVFGLVWRESIFIGVVLSATSVTISARTLMDLKQNRSRAGSTILGAAVFDDVLGLILLSLVLALGPELSNGGAVPWRELAITLLRMAGCLATIFWLGPPLTRWLMKHSEHWHGHQAELAAALTLMFLLAFHAEWTGGMAAITGAYLAGLFVAATQSHERVLHDLRPMINAFFGPLFFVSIGLEINARQLAGHFGFFLGLLLVAMLGKICGAGAGAYFSGFGWRDSLIVGAGMIPRGEVELIAASIGWTSGIISREIYVQVVVLVLITTLSTPSLLRLAFPKDALAEAVARSGNLDHLLQEEIETPRDSGKA
jgi:Kef-type K+ transport system membrane component KefB